MPRNVWNSVFHALQRAGARFGSEGGTSLATVTRESRSPSPAHPERPNAMPNRSLSIVLFAAPLTAATAHAQTFGPPQRFITPGVLSPTAIDTADLDGDGRPDLVCSGAGDDRVVWFPNLATGGFGVARVITAQADGASCVVAADLDQDGDVDVVASSAEDDTVAWFENDGTGNAWTEHVVSSQTLGAADVFVADVNGDGTLDILTAAKDEGTLAWHENLGGGSFSSRNLLSISMPGIELVAALDLDGDGDLEVLCATGWNAPSWVFENLGAGAFAPEDQLTGQGGHMHIVRIADMDGDGDDDLLTSIQDTFGYDQVLWMENDGSGSFGAWHQVGDYLDTAYLVEPTDFDEDGDLDIVHVRGEPFYHYPGNIGWYENLGGGVFAPDRGARRRLPRRGLLRYRRRRRRRRRRLADGPASQ